MPHSHREKTDEVWLRALRTSARSRYYREVLQDLRQCGRGRNWLVPVMGRVILWKALV